MEELISVIVPVYNVEKYLERCVSSIVNQSYNKLQIILVDDGSTDSSSKICDQLKKTDDRIIVVHKENGGLSSARNCGMDYATGSFLAFIDSDDLIHKDFFKVMIEARAKTHADIVSTDLFLFSEESEISSLESVKGDYIVLEGLNILKEYFVQPQKRRYIYHGLCMKIYKSDLFDGLKFEEGRVHEDLYITYKLLDRVKVFCYINAPYYFYCQSNTGSICKNYGKKNYIDTLIAVNNTEEYFKCNNDIQSELTHYLVLMYTDLISKGTNMDDNEIQASVKELKVKTRKLLKNDKQIGVCERCFISMKISCMKIINFIKK